MPFNARDIARQMEPPRRPRPITVTFLKFRIIKTLRKIQLRLMMLKIIIMLT
jgi:hypothetical protein